MEEELNEHELEERLYSMLHYVDETQANITTNQDALSIIENAPRSTVRRYWRTNGDYTTTPINTPFQKINTPKEALKPTPDDTKPKKEECKSPVEPLPKHLSLFQSPVPKNIRKTIEIIETENVNVVELESSDEDDVIEVALPPKPTITIDSSEEDEISLETSPIKEKPNGLDKNSNNREREVSASPVPSIVSSVSDEFIRGDCIAFNISSRRPDDHSFDFSLHGPDLLGSTPSKKKKKKKNKESATSTPINVDTSQKKSNIIDECFATPKSKAKNKKQRTKSYTVSEKSIPNADVYDSDSNQSIIETNKNRNTFIVTEKSLPCPDETDSNLPEHQKKANKSKETRTIEVESSDSSINLDKDLEDNSINIQDKSTDISAMVTIDLTGNVLPFNDETIEENILVANVTGFTEPDDYDDKPTSEEAPKYGSTKVPAILYENLDFDNLKGKEKVCKNRRYSLTTLRAEMEKFYNESWGGEDFNHREIQKNMSRDKNLWAIDPKDRMSSMSRKKYNVTCNYCNRPGHRDDMCRLKPPVCFMCGNTGHMEPRCPSKICVNCGSPNYMYSTMCRNCSTWGRITCAECSQVGHPSSHCPDLWRRYHDTIDLSSHLEESRLFKKHYQLFCSGCTRRGHLVHTCRLSLPFSGLAINSPYVHMYRPIYAPVPDTNTDQKQNIQRPNRPTVRHFQQDSTISSATKNDRNKRQSKSPTLHEAHVNKKRNLSMSDLPERQTTKSPAVQETLRKRSKSKEPAEISEGTDKDQDKCPTATVPESTEKALDFIPIVSSNHDKQGQVIQDNEVSDTSDVITSARIYVTNDVVNTLKTKEGEEWLKINTNKFHVAVENTDISSFLSIKGKLCDQEAFQTALRNWVKGTSNSEQADNEVDVTQPSDDDQSIMSHNIPKNRNKVLRKLSKALESLNEDIGEPNALFKELNYLEIRHQNLLNQKVINHQQLSNNRNHINEMLKKLNMVLLGQAGLADGTRHIRRLYSLQQKLINYRQKNLSADLRKQIGEHFHCIFTAFHRTDYGDLIKSFNGGHFKKTIFKKKNKLVNVSPKTKKFSTIQAQNQHKIRNPTIEIKGSNMKRNCDIISSKSPNPRNPLVEKTMNKLVFYQRRLMQACPNDMVLKKTRVELLSQLHSHIDSIHKNDNTSSKSLKKMKKVQEQAQLFLSNV